VDCLARHEKRVIIPPISVVVAKRVESATVSGSAVRKKSASGFAKQALLKFDHAAVLNALLGQVWYIGQVLRRQEALLPKRAQIDY
jgi:hypothetical protein